MRASGIVAVINRWKKACQFSINLAGQDLPFRVFDLPKTKSVFGFFQTNKYP
jgi:hypothetical protein